MPIIIRDRTIYTSDGIALKKIHCPRKMVEADLAAGSDGNFQCQHCSNKVFNTDHMTEDEVVSLLKKDPDTCLFINLANPLFEVQK